MAKEINGIDHLSLAKIAHQRLQEQCYMVFHSPEAVFKVFLEKGDYSLSHQFRLP